MSMEESIGRKSHRSAVQADAKCAWPRLPEELKQDKEIILAALRSPTLPCKALFERQWPQNLRMDRDIVLAFAHREDFEKIYYERHLFVPESLTNDKEVMMAYCRRIPRSLQECSEVLTDDREIVSAALEVDGLELQYASIRLQEDKEMVKKACWKDGRALEFCPPGRLRKELTSDREFMLTVLRQHGGPMLRLVSEPLRCDRELLLEALKHGMRLRFCPFDLLSEKTFLLEALAQKSEIYLEMNKSAQNDPEIALAAVTSPDSTPAVHCKAIQNIPGLLSSRLVVLAIAARGDRDFLKKHLDDSGAQFQFRDDKEVMVAVIERNEALYRYASAQLQVDRDVLLAAMQKPSVLTIMKNLPLHIQQEYPEITAKAINVGDRKCLRLLRSYIPIEMWMNRDVTIAWLRRGCRIVDASEPLLRSDQELALEVAQHAWFEFARIGEGLKRDAHFMRRAVDVNGRVLRFASQEIRNDIDIVVRAVASHPDALVQNVRLSKSEITEYIQSKLDLHKTFVNDFLRGIAVATPRIPPSRRSQLPMLDRGVETSQAFKILIAEFLGVPIGENLRVMRQAWNNITQVRTSEPESDYENYNADGTHLPRRFRRRRDAVLMEDDDDGARNIIRLRLARLRGHEEQAAELRLADEPDNPHPRGAFVADLDVFGENDEEDMVMAMMLEAEDQEMEGFHLDFLDGRHPGP